MAVPLDRALYDAVKAEASAKFLAPTSAYRSAWIVAQYKRRGGRYAPNAREGRLTRWFDERWVDVLRPRAGGGFEACGRARASPRGPYPTCRPSRRVSALTPATVAELGVSRLRRAARAKQRLRHTGALARF